MEGSKLYVGNLKYSVTEEELKELFSKYGTVSKVTIIGDKGFGFVEMDTVDAAEKAKTLDGTDFQGRTMKVNTAKPKEGGSRGGDRGGDRGSFRKFGGNF
jgi:RNA recognition motif-containing protein